MTTLVLPSAEELTIPPIATLDEFRRWRDSDGVPEKLKAHFFNGEVWIDDMPEEFYTHNILKGAIFAALDAIAAQEDLGVVSTDGVLVTNDDANLATEPDAMFISHASFSSGAARHAAGALGNATVLVGTPDLVVEVVSRTSVRKDTVRLPELYHAAGVPEFWRVDGRGGAVDFLILTRGEDDYAGTPGEWQRSPTFGREFRITCAETRPGVFRYRLEAR